MTIFRESAYSEAFSEMTIDEERNEEVRRGNKRRQESSSSEQGATADGPGKARKRKSTAMKKLVRKT